MLRYELGSGVTSLEVQSPRSTVAHRLVCRRLAETDGPAYWIDARNAAVTHALYDSASSPRVLADLRIARAFTAHQHHSLVRRAIREASPSTSLLVAPNVASLYDDPDLDDREAETLLTATLEHLAAIGEALDCPVLVTTTSGRADRVAEYAATRLACVRTREGLRLEDEDGDAVTAGYWHGSYWQTTIPYWVECCGVRHRYEAAAHDPLEVTA